MSPPRIGLALLVAADVALAGAALWIAYALRFDLELLALESWVEKAPFEEYAKLYSLLALAVPVLSHLHGLYRTDGLHTTLEESYAIAKVVTLATGIVLAITFFYREFVFSRLTMAYFWFLAVVLISFAHSLFRRWLLGRYRAGLDRRRTVVVGEPKGYLLDRLRSEPAFGIDVVGYVGGEPESEDPEGDRSGRAGVLVRSATAQGRTALAAPPRLGAIRDLPQILAACGIDEAVIVEGGITHRALLETIDACERGDVEVRLVPPIYDLLVDPRDLTYVEGVPLVRIDEARFHRTRQIVKRAFDVAVSAALLAVLAPALLLIAVLIRRGSPGGALFVQTRAGRGGKPFKMLKFRTMVKDAEARLAEVVDLDALAEPVFKVAADPRVTPIGRVLRRLSLDEMPQLVNVLRGDMSLVGPRPEELKIVERYDVWQRRRLKVKPGITGLQQVEARGTLSNLNERVRLDIFYTRKQSFLLDLLILIRTVAVVLGGKGAT